MITITIEKEVKLSKTHFRDLEELQLELASMKEDDGFYSEHLKILKGREKESDKATDVGLSWDEVKSSLTRKNA